MSGKVTLNEVASCQVLVQVPLLAVVAFLEYSTLALAATLIGPVNVVVKFEFPFIFVKLSKTTGFSAIVANVFLITIFQVASASSEVSVLSENPLPLVPSTNLESNKPPWLKI